MISGYYATNIGEYWQFYLINVLPFEGNKQNIINLFLSNHSGYILWSLELKLKLSKYYKLFLNNTYSSHTMIHFTPEISP